MTAPARYKLEVVAPIFPVTDIKRSLEYYTEALLFVVGFEWADASDEAIRYAVLQSGNCELHLTHSEKPQRAVAYFFVDGVIEYYEAVKARNSNITCEIEDQPWEMREFEVADPDGNRLIFGEHLSRLKDTKGHGK
jgi:catechol 2,3-dioxygenase-like lactoylglutathione lyase family enzyme